MCWVAMSGRNPIYVFPSAKTEEEAMEALKKVLEAEGGWGMHEELVYSLKSCRIFRFKLATLIA